MTPQTHSTPLFEGEKRVKTRFILVTDEQLIMRRQDSPISLRLEKPAVIGACLGDLPRFGALDDQTLQPSPRDFSLQADKTMSRQHTTKKYYFQIGRIKKDRQITHNIDFFHHISRDNCSASGRCTDRDEILIGRVCFSVL